MRATSILIALAAVSIVPACSESTLPPAPPDASGGMDAARADSGTGDRDAGPIVGEDAGGEDGGIELKDAGPDPEDAGPIESDGGPIAIDSGPIAIDAGSDSAVPVAIDSGTDGGTPIAIDSGIDSGIDAGRDSGIDSGIDAGRDSGIDAGIDAGRDSGIDTGIDAGPAMTSDAGMMCSTPPEGPSPFPGCNPTDGIECDGNWSGRCTPACTASQCCSPQRNRFQCVPRLADGSCPIADLWVDDTRLAPYIETRTFAPGDCAIVEGCVGGSGTRRLLRFDTWTPNTGGADMFLGVPSASSPHFTYSSCHGHYHFDSYAEYELLTEDESCVAAVGHKQAFCLLDYYDYPCSETGAGGLPRCSRISGGYTCGNQGIRRDAQDVYDATLDCQWIDITGVPAGDYVIRIRINTEHILNESRYDNNEVRVPVTIPPGGGTMGTDISMACPTRTTGPNRDCGYTRNHDGTCTPGATVEVGCSTRCSLGACTGDSIMRVCERAVGTNCTIANDLVTNDDSGCGGGTCGSGGDCCSRATFTCPSTGTYTVWTGAYDSAAASTCTIAVR